MYLFLYFLKFILSIYFFEDHIGNKCAIVCFNVSILGKYYIYMYYNVLPNKLTHSHSHLLVTMLVSMFYFIYILITINCYKFY